ETNINSNYRAEQQAYFAATAGLEEARDRMWLGTLKDTGGLAVALPTVLPTLANKGVIYLTNPTAKDGSVHPWDPNSPYFDDELCHEGYAALNMADSGVGTRCDSTSLPSGTGWYVEVPSTAPYTGTDAALAFKWVRITVKNNRAANPYYVDGTGVSTNTVCWNQYWSQEELLSRKAQPAAPARDANNQVQLAGNKKSWLRQSFDSAFDLPVAYAFDKGKTGGNSGNDKGNGGSGSAGGTGGGGAGGTGGAGTNLNPTTCEDPTQAFPRKAVYIVTALAKTTTGGRKMVQYELANNTFLTPPAPAPLTIIGPTPTYGSASSENFTISGTDNHQGKDGSGKGACTGAAANTDAIVASTSTEANAIIAALKRPDLYTGVGASPDVIAVSTAGANWKDINFLNAMISSLRDQAQSTGRYYSTFNNGAAPTNFGSSSAPLFTFVDGNVTAASGAGLLVVTGDFVASGNFSWDGVILVIGDGSFTINGGGNSQITGGVVVAKTGSLDSASSPTKLIPASTLGIPSFNWNGGGTNAMQWDSCWANVMNGSSGNYFKVISFRETMY
ncbi:MAG TPA: hypothetical protein VEW69_10610, partial [Alphaproteobacteria bacterium]|nr:hypothetical protein [Alphaproteobacteria bacterium]